MRGDGFCHTGEEDVGSTASERTSGGRLLDELAGCRRRCSPHATVLEGVAIALLCADCSSHEVYHCTCRRTALGVAVRAVAIVGRDIGARAAPSRRDGRRVTVVAARCRSRSLRGSPAAREPEAAREVRCVAIGRDLGVRMMSRAANRSTLRRTERLQLRQS
jgi:hypothetical protein